MDNTIKTIGDLRKFLEAQGGEIILGKIKISCIEGQDIDFHYDFNIMQWIPSSYDDDKKIDEQMIYSHMAGYKWRAEPSKDAPAEVVPEEKEESKPVTIRYDDPVIVLGYKAQGAVEAYEKIFITGGRKITLE